MPRVCSARVLAVLLVLGAVPPTAWAQGTVPDYQRALGLRERYQNAAPGMAEPATWIEGTPRFWYRRSVKNGNEFVLVDAETLRQGPAFDHEKLAAALSKASGVPKSFSAFNQMQAQAEIGFVVVQIDGMGTSNRSKAFHDVAWKNLKDAGFPDRILWHKAVASKYPWYDISRVGIYGTSAGGQSALGALLFHPEFYKAAVSAAGCHDNRMDKIWWNEQWMGWPIGPQYAESSNVDNAYRLQGKVLLVVGEMDTNVDPSSTMQVVNQLIKHDKDFDLLVVPGMGHGNGGPYGEHKRFDFFARNLLGVTPPEWSALRMEEKKEKTEPQ